MYKLLVFLFFMIFIFSCSRKEGAGESHLKNIMIDTDPDIDTSVYKVKSFNHQSLTYNVAYYNEVTEHASVYIFEDKKLINKIDGKELKGVIMDVELIELTSDSIPELLLYSYYDGGKFSQENHLYIYQTPFSYEKRIFSYPLSVSISSYDENLEKIGENNIVDVDFEIEEIDKRIILKFKGRIDQHPNSFKRFIWNSDKNKFESL